MDKELLMFLVASPNEVEIEKAVDRFFNDKKFSEEDKLLIMNSLLVYSRKFMENIEKTSDIFKDGELKIIRETSLDLH